MIFVLVPVLLPIAACQFSMAVVCARRYPSTRIPAIVLMLVSPLQVLIALLGEHLYLWLHEPSSFDPLGDGIDGLLKTMFGTVVSALVAAAVSLWLAVWIPHPRDTAGQQDE